MGVRKCYNFLSLNCVLSVFVPTVQNASRRLLKVNVVIQPVLDCAPRLHKVGHSLALVRLVL